jgi:AraC family transcriptional regulator
MDDPSIAPRALSQTPAAPALLTSLGRGWNGLEAEFLRIPAGRTKVAATLSHRLGMHYGAPVNAHCRCDGRVHRRVQSHGDADFVPAGLDGEWQDDADCTILRLSLSAALLRQTAEDLGVNPDRVALAPRFQLRDPGIEHIAWALKVELETTSFTDRLYADSLGVALAARLVHLTVGQPGGASRPSRQTLSPRQESRLLAFIEANLGQKLSLADLAAVAGVSLSQLKALFPISMGAPVNQYVLRRRVERAKSLLLAGDLPISQVALEAGFAHQSHMAHCMKRVLGLTPRRLLAMRQ